MAIKYALFPNHLTSADDYMAIVQDQTSKDRNQIIDQMIGRGSTVTKAEALAVLEEFEAAVQDALSNGFSINTPLFKISPSIQGVFDSESEGFDRSKHYLKLNVTSGGRISQIATGLKVEKVAASSPVPNLSTFKDVTTGTINETLSPGGVGEVTGSRLKIDEADTLQGVFLIAADGTATRAITYVRNMPSNLIFMIPAGLVAGEYELEVRANAKNSKETRKGVLITPLTVV